MTDIFIKIDGIPGDSADVAHPGEIEVLSWHWDIARYRSNDSTPLYGNGRKGVGSLGFAHRIGRASPNLMSFCLKGQRIPKAILSMRLLDRNSHDFFVVTMSNVLIDSLSPMGADHSYVEKVVLSFTTVKEEFVELKPTGGKAVVSAVYDMYRQN